MSYPGIRIHTIDTPSIMGYLEGESQTRFEQLQERGNQLRVYAILQKILDISPAQREATLATIEGLLENIPSKSAHTTKPLPSPALHGL